MNTLQLANSIMNRQKFNWHGAQHLAMLHFCFQWFTLTTQRTACHLLQYKECKPNIHYNMAKAKNVFFVLIYILRVFHWHKKACISIDHMSTRIMECTIAIISTLEVSGNLICCQCRIIITVAATGINWSTSWTSNQGYGKRKVWPQHLATIILFVAIIDACTLPFD